MGDPDNIQFLTREEYLETHKGSWQNPTNWYYNPETKEFVDFGENKPIPCEVISLSEPVRSPAIDTREISDGLRKSPKSEDASTAQMQSSRQEEVSHHAGNPSQNKTTTPPEVQESFGDKILHVVDAVKEFSEKHPVLTGIVKWGGAAAATIVAAAVANNSSGEGGSSGDGGSDYLPSSDSSDDYMSLLDRDDYSVSSSSRDYPEERSSPEEHTVPAHGQHYHTKDGVIWKEKEPYQRGGKHDDE